MRSILPNTTKNNIREFHQTNNLFGYLFVSVCLPAWYCLLFVFVGRTLCIASCFCFYFQFLIWGGARILLKHRLWLQIKFCCLQSVAYIHYICNGICISVFSLQLLINFNWKVFFSSRIKSTFFLHKRARWKINNNNEWYCFFLPQTVPAKWVKLKIKSLNSINLTH